MQANVADGRCDVLGEGEGASEGASEARLVDVAEADILAEEFCDGFGLVPRTSPFATRGGRARTDVSVEGSVDLDDVEESREIFNGMNFLARDLGGARDAVPIFCRTSPRCRRGLREPSPYRQAR